MTLKYRHFKAWIYCEDTRKILEEFQARQDPADERVFECWVPSEAGKRFTVYWDSLMERVCDNRGVVFVDGMETHSYVNIRYSGKTGASSGVKMATGEIKPYSFSNVVLTDDDAYLGVEQSTNTDELGNITVKIYLVRAHYEMLHRPKPQRRRRSRQEISLYEGVIHESSKKICDHRITLGEAVPFGPPRHDRPQTRKLVWEPYDSHDEAPYVVFRFKYRPRAFLQAQGIIPSPTHISETPAHTLLLNTTTQSEAKSKGQKRKRLLLDSPQRNIDGRARSELPLFLPSPSLLREPSPRIQSRDYLRPIFRVETPPPMEQDEEVVILGHSQRSVNIKQENESPFDRNVRAKHGPVASMKIEADVPLYWIDGNGVIDLTMDD